MIYMDLSREILAYALQNAIEHGKADAGRVLPKLFQHGLDKKDVSKIMPEIQEIVKRVNSASDEERVKLFAGVEGVVKKHERKDEHELPELPPSEIGKKVVLRMAPFPSGAVHIGNAKTFLLNALYAEKYDGDLLLVMDDTIGSTEKPLAKDSYDLIVDAWKMLDVKYKKVYYKSDRLDIYYEYAEKLIDLNKAYVCHCVAEVLRQNRADAKECACRQFPIGLQKERWKEMFKPEVKEGSTVLRIKTDMTHPNPAFRDRVLFRIADRPHPRVGNKYRVWPTLEMTWAVDDHLFGITHVIRGNDLMIESDMEKYIWDLFRWKHPVLIHTGMVRLEGVGAKLSKSKAQKEVLSGQFSGWDDPRTWSVQSLVRRGITKEAIREFVKRIGLNKQDIIVPVEALYALNRQILDSETLRYSFVQDAVSLNISNMSELAEISVPIHPDKQEQRVVKLGKEIFISQKDFDNLNGNEVRLIHLFNVKVGANSEITSVDNKKIPKINWVSDGVKARVLLVDGNFVEGLVESAATKLKKGDVVQFERFGFVKFDGVHNGVPEFWFAHS